MSTVKSDISVIPHPAVSTTSSTFVVLELTSKFPKMQPSRAMLGNESADAARARFAAAVDSEVASLEPGTNLVVVSHGTVMALFVAAYNPVNAWDLWKRLACTDTVVLALPGFGLVEVSES